MSAAARATVRATVRAAVRATVRATVRAAPHAILRASRAPRVAVAALLVACGGAEGSVGPRPGGGPVPPSRPPVASIVVYAPRAPLVVGATHQLVVVARDARDAPLPGRTVVWTSEQPDVATVTPPGLVTARAPGAVWLVVTCEGHTARVQLGVVAAAAGG